MQVPPSPRHGHTAVWDTSDSLIVFGGISSTSQCLADVHVLSLSTGFWSSPQCSGDIPRARANHAAVMWGPNLMLLFGGCDPKAAGRFMNDVFVLDTVTFTWHCLDAMGTPPAPRYWHSMVSLQGKTVVYGGSNATRCFDQMFTISSDWTRYGTCTMILATCLSWVDAVTLAFVASALQNSRPACDC